MRSLTRILIYLFVFVFPVSAISQPETILDHQTVYNLSNVFHHYTDTSNRLTITDIIHKDSCFSENKIEGHPYFGHSHSTIWLYTDIKNISDDELHFIQIAHATLDDIEFYLIQKDSLINKQVSGTNNLIESQYKTYTPLASFKLLKDETYRIYIRVRSISYIYLPITISRASYFYSASNRDRNFIFALVISLFVIAVINLAIYLSIKELPYLLLGFAIACISAYFFLFYGILSDYGIYMSSTSLIKIRLILFQLTYLLAAFFSAKFLKIEKADKYPIGILSAVVIIFGVYLISTILIGRPLKLLNSMALYTYPLGAILLTVVGAFKYKSDTTVSLVYMAANSTFVISALLYFGILIGKIPHSFIVNNIPLIGVFLYSIILTLSLNLKIGNLNKEIERTRHLERLSQRLRSEIETRLTIEIELREINLSKDKFISIIAHDLKNPFNAILGFGQLLESINPKEETEKTKRYTKQIINAAQKAYSLLEDLLTWSKAQSGTIVYTPLKTNFCDLSDKVIENMLPQAINKEITIKKNCVKECWIEIDTNMVETVLRNLLSNAIKFTNKHGHIQMKVQDYETDIVVSIIDNGVGMSEEQINTLFKIDNNFTTIGTANETGTGLGLLVCKEFIDRHNGTIWAESEEGAGSSFSFLLPRSP